MKQRAAVVLLLASTALIVWATLTPNAFDPVHRLPPAWCVRCGGRWLTDAISNIVLFVPFGAALALAGVRTLRVVALSLIVSVVVEYCQYIGWPSGRSAATADIITNAVGGAVGAWVVSAWHGLLFPSPRRAAMLAWAWSTMTTVVFAVTAYAISDHPRSTPPRFEKSVRTHTPNYGWYGGTNDSARVGSLLIRKGSGGPIIVNASHRPDTIEAMVTVRGRDRNTAFVPLLYIHVGDDSSAVFIIGQHDGNAELRVTRRAWDLGLNMPTLMLPRVFASRAVTDTSALMLTASATSSHLRLTAFTARDTVSATRALDISLGWVLIQTVFDLDSPMAPVAVSLWLAALVAPIGWWAAHSAQGVRQSGNGVALLLLPLLLPLLAAVWLIPVWFNVAPLATFDVARLVVPQFVVIWLARRVRATPEYAFDRD